MRQGLAALVMVAGLVVLPAPLAAQARPAAIPAESEAAPSPTIQRAVRAMQTGRWADALADWQAVLERLRASGQAGTPTGLMAMRGVAGCLIELGRHAEALPLLEQVQGLQERSGSGVSVDDRMATLLGLAVARDATGDAAGGNALIERYIAHYRGVRSPGPVQRVQLATGLFQQARMAQRQAQAGDAARWEVAISAMREAIPMMQSAGPNPQGLAGQTFTLSEMLLSANRIPEAISTAEEAARLMEAAFGANHALSIQALENAGTIRIYRTEDEAPALPLIERACAAWRALGDAKRADLRRCLTTYADGLNYVDRDVDEVPVRREVVVLTAAIDGEASDAALAASDSLVEALVQIDAIAEARAEADRVLSLPSVAARPTVAVVALRRRLAEMAVSRADYPTARAHYLAISEALSGVADRSNERAAAEAMLGFLAMQANNVAEADAIFERVMPTLRTAEDQPSRNALALVEPLVAIARMRNGRGEDTSAVAAVLDGSDAANDTYAQAFAALTAGQYARADEAFHRARDRLELVHPADRRTDYIRGLMAFTSAMRAYALDGLDRHADAERLFRAALSELAPLTVQSVEQFRASAAYGLGDLLWRLDRDAEAVPLLRQSIRSAQIGGIADDLYVQMARTRLASAIRFSHAGSTEPLRILAESLTDVRQARMRAALGSDAGTNVADQALARATASERSYNDPLRSVFRLYLSEAARTPYLPRAQDPAFQDAVFGVAQDLAASHAGSAMRATAARLSLGEGIAGELLREQAALADQVRGVEVALASARQANDAASLAARIGERDALAAQLAAVDARIDAEAPQYRLLIAPRAIDLAGFRSRLRPGEALILVAGAGDDGLYVITVSRDAFAWHSVARPAEANAMIERMRCSMDPAACRPAGELDGSLPPFDSEAAWQVWHRLIEPVMAPLAGAERIFVTASGRLGELPFAALVTSPPQPGTETQWFGDRASFVLLPSVAALRAMPRELRAAERRPRYVAYGAPDLAQTADAPPPDQAAMPKGLANPALLRASFGPLTTAGREMQEVAQAMGADPASIHADRAATEAAVRADQRISVARIVHFATHGLLPDPEAPTPILGEPGLVFTPPAMPSPEDDGVLSASEVSGMRLSADWLILSACTTATAGGGDSAIGDPDSLGVLSRAFLFAGARRLVASHWNLSAVTGRLIVTRMLKDVTLDPTLHPSQALARTQRALRTGRYADGSEVFGWDREWQHPFFWAPLSIIAYDDDA